MTRQEKEGLVRIFLHQRGYLFAALSSPGKSLKLLKVLPSRLVEQDKIFQVYSFVQSGMSRLRFEDETCVHIEPKLMGGGKHEIATTLNNLGISYHNQGNLPLAIEHFTKALAIWKKTYGEKHPDVTTCMKNLGLAYHAQKNLP